jgi:ubiquinol-cytochrome c reductase cytochrome c1 subunit
MGKHMNKLKHLIAVLLLAPAFALAAGGEVKLDRAPIDENDEASLQRGARHFVNYCLNCHSASYMRFNRMRDIGLTDQQILDNLVFTGVKVGDLMKVAMDPKDSKAWFGAAPPELSLIARSRASHAGSGADWLYSYLRGFYRDAERPTGWNNTVFPNVGMPHVLWELQGEQVLAEKKVQGAGFEKTEMALKLDKPGKLSTVEYDQMVADLVNYLVFMAEPARASRTTIGMFVLVALGLLFVLAYALKKEYWKDVH